MSTARVLRPVPVLMATLLAFAMPLIAGGVPAEHMIRHPGSRS